jgi:TolB-like protein/Tfp pilus assembly protein PilF
VFLSYASQDAEAARRICDALRASGIEVWFDQSELRGGDAWDRQIRKQIKACALFIPVLSKHTHDRIEGYFRLEWKLAIDRSHLIAPDQTFLLPVAIDNTRQDDERVPDRFREVHWTRLPAGETPPAFIERVRRLLSSELSTTTGPPEGAVSHAVPPSRERVRTSWRSKPVLLAIVAIGVAALGYFVADKFWISKHLTPPPAAFAPPPHSIAVLPFTNLSGDPKQEYFSDGVSEELINALSHIDSLQVTARTSSFSYKGQNADIGTIARKLNVGAILEGSIRRSGNTVRITAQLINTVSGYHMWSEDYDRGLVDILALQTEIATTVAQQLRARLVGNEPDRIEVGNTRDPEAYDAYLRGLQTMSSAEDVRAYRAALASFDQAIALDPRFAAAHVRRAAMLFDIWTFGEDLHEGDDLRTEARRAADTSMRLAPELADAHSVLAGILMLGYLDFSSAAREDARALALAPGRAVIQSNSGVFAAVLGHHSMALAQMRRAIELDPRNFQYRFQLAQVHYYARRYGDAIQAARDAQALQPNTTAVDWFSAFGDLALGHSEAARQRCESPSARLEDDSRQICLAIAYHALGLNAEAEVALAKVKLLPSKRADVYAQWRDRRAAVESLRAAVRLHDPGLMLLRVEWMLDPIRNEPEFKALERQLNFPP